MPEGMTDAILRERAATLAQVCMREGCDSDPGSTLDVGRAARHVIGR